MQPTDLLYLDILKDAVMHSTNRKALSPEEEAFLSRLAHRHYTSAFLLPYLHTEEVLRFQKQQVRQLLLNYYQIDQFTAHIAALLEARDIPYFLLKGISLAAYYPEPESRKLGDVDLYINDPDALQQAKELLKKDGFVEIDELSDHHLTYTYTFPSGARYTLELHFRVIGLYQYTPANRLVDQIYASRQLTPEIQVIGSHAYPVLPPDAYVFYMLHHMLKHYLYSGFGIRLLLDFTFYLNARSADVDFDKIHDWCRQSHILHFYEIILSCCRTYLGLHPDIDAGTTAPKTDCDTFLTRILEEKDMGTVEAATLVGSGVYRRITPLTYFKEGHLQMHVRFPQLGKCVLLWPVLWGITLICFLKNTYRLRHTTLKDTLRAFRENNQTARSIRIFDDSDC